MKVHNPFVHVSFKRKCAQLLNQNIITRSYNEMSCFSLVIYARVLQSFRLLKPCTFLTIDCKLHIPRTTDEEKHMYIYIYIYYFIYLFFIIHFTWMYIAIWKKKKIWHYITLQL